MDLNRVIWYLIRSFAIRLFAKTKYKFLYLLFFLSRSKRAYQTYAHCASRTNGSKMIKRGNFPKSTFPPVVQNLFISCSRTLTVTEIISKFIEIFCTNSSFIHNCLFQWNVLNYLFNLVNLKITIIYSSTFIIFCFFPFLIIINCCVNVLNTLFF